jgi:hypothetical protein
LLKPPHRFDFPKHPTAPSKGSIPSSARLKVSVPVLRKMQSWTRALSSLRAACSTSGRSAAAATTTTTTSRALSEAARPSLEGAPAQDWKHLGRIILMIMSTAEVESRAPTTLHMQTALA